MTKYIVHIRDDKPCMSHFIEFDTQEQIEKWYKETSIHEKAKEEGVSMGVYSFLPLFTQTLTENNGQ